MGKGTIGKKGKAPSLHSRAARRATSPGIDTDKSLKDVKPPPVSVNQRPSVLAAHHASGISRKAKHGRKAALSSKARRRHEKDMDRAANVHERTLKKTQRSKVQARSLHSRSRPWEEVNDAATGTTRVTAKQAAKLREQELVRQFFAEGGEMDVEDDGMEETEEDATAEEGEERQQRHDSVQVPTERITNMSLADPATVPLPPPPQDDGDEIL